MSNIYNEIIPHIKIPDNCEIESILDLGNYWVISFMEIGVKDDFDLDYMYKYDKNTYKKSPFSIFEDHDIFLKALKNPVYIKNKEF